MFTLPELPYAYDALEPFIDEATMHFHHDKHHAAYVDNLNKALEGQKVWADKPIEEIIAHISDVPETIRTKVKNNAGGHYNHSLFWVMMAPNKDQTVRKPAGKIAKAIDTGFGGFDAFKEKFSTAGMGRFGSGWVWLVSDNGTLLIVDTPNQDSPLSEGKIPLLGLDVWEHAYYLKYQNKRADYIQNWWNVVNWDEVEKRYAASA